MLEMISPNIKLCPKTFSRNLRLRIINLQIIGTSKKHTFKLGIKKDLTMCPCIINNFLQPKMKCLQNIKGHIILRLYLVVTKSRIDLWVRLHISMWNILIYWFKSFKNYNKSQPNKLNNALLNDLRSHHYQFGDDKTDY